MNDNYDKNIENEIYNDNSRIIGVSGKNYLVTNNESATIDSIYDYGALFNKDGVQISPTTLIGTLTKFGYVEPMEDIFKNRIHKKEFLVKDALLGFAIGDAFGVPVEFLSRDEIKKINISEMMGNGTHNVPAGSWSDDTSMLISSMDSIIQKDGEIDYKDIMDKFIDWLYRAKYTSIDKTFGVGNIIYHSLLRYRNGMEPLECGGKEYMDNGNGSLMRILPFSLYCILNNLNEEKTYEIICNASQLTHAHDISKMSCFMYTEYLREAINTKNPVLALEKIQNIDYKTKFSQEAIDAHKNILKKNFLYTSSSKIKESGYVVDTLEAVLYGILNNNNYKDTIITVVKLGYDTDTAAGIAGAVAGAIYGEEDIPKNWMEKLKKKEYLEDLANKFQEVMKKKIEQTNSRTK